ncbi:MAG: response regulator receiver domain, partial [Flavobacteriaceae bacterium]
MSLKKYKNSQNDWGTLMTATEYSVAREFLRTAVIIDDKAELIDPGADNEVPEVVEPTDAEGEQEAELSVIETAAQPKQDVKDGQLNVGAVIGGFFQEGIMCGVFQPEENISAEELVKDTTKAVVNSDIVILDWYLRPNDEKLILSLLEAIFSSDKEQNGRLRLIIIYTDNPNLAKCATAIQAKLAPFGLHDSTSGDQFLLEAAGVRIKLFNKEGAVGPAPVKEAELASQAILEFSYLGKGLFPLLALAGVNSIRKNTHHLLSIFSRNLDPALVGHRLLLKDGEDAAVFGLEVLVQQLRSLLSTNRIHHNYLSEDRFLNWFDENFDHEGEGEVNPGAVPLSIVRDALKSCYDEVFKSRGGEMRGVKGKMFPRHAHKRLFSEDAEKEKEATALLGRLSKVSREFEGLHRLPKDWRPTLSLGSILKRQVKKTWHYYFCAMPACDAVRIDEGKRFFPLLSLVPTDSGNETDFWLSIWDETQN